jgi:DNA/RNA-binding domain of Phe-tRNA-synthetase-like protein
MSRRQWQPSWNRSVLLVAYRELNNLPFSKNEQKALVRNWQAEYEQLDINEKAKTAAIENWLKRVIKY